MDRAEALSFFGFFFGLLFTKSAEDFVVEKFLGVVIFGLCTFKLLHCVEIAFLSFLFNRLPTKDKNKQNAWSWFHKR